MSSPCPFLLLLSAVKPHKIVTVFVLCCFSLQILSPVGHGDANVTNTEMSPCLFCVVCPIKSRNGHGDSSVIKHEKVTVFLMCCLPYKMSRNGHGDSNVIKHKKVTVTFYEVYNTKQTR